MSDIPPAALAEDPEDLYENAPCGYLSLLPDGTVVKVNLTFLSWTGYPRADLVGRRRFQSLLSAGGRIFFETHYAPLLAMQGTVREIALDLVCADGRRLPVLVNAVLKRDAEGQPLVVRTTVFNATDRRSYEQELLRARREAERAEARVQALARRAVLAARLSRALAEVPDVPGRARRCVELLAAELSGWALLDLAEGVLGRGADAQAGGPGRGADAPTGGPGRVVGAPSWAEPGAAPPEAASGGPGAPGPPSAGQPTSVALPLSAHGRRLGTLTLVRSPRRPFDADELPFLADLADRVALGLENARLYEQERHHALTLQRSLLAGELPADPRVGLVTRYLPAGDVLEVGGDWYDAFPVGDRRLGVVVGDVVGRGIEAASAMGQLRSAVRAVAGGDGGGPGRVLDRIDTFVERLPAARLATVAYAEVDPVARTARYACAGQPPPTVVVPGEPPRLLWQGRSAPLGVRGRTRRRAEARVDLPAGSRLLLYSDGLVERRGEPIDDGLDRLLTLLARHRDRPLAAMADATIEALLDGEPSHDDVCVLAAELVPGA